MGCCVKLITIQNFNLVLLSMQKRLYIRQGLQSMNFLLRNVIVFAMNWLKVCIWLNQPYRSI
jgi:hypothetical protein